MTQGRLIESEQHAEVLRIALSPGAARLHIVAGAIATAWSRDVPLADALECARDVVSCMEADVGIAHVAWDAIEYRRSQPEMYPAWQLVSRSRAMCMATVALGVWCMKGWRR